MISLDTFLTGMLITSTFTGLTTEALKKLFTECNVTYKSNVLAGIVSLFTSLLLGVGYISAYGIPFTSHSILCLVALVFMSWLCAMLGYDKVLQTVTQFKTTKNKD